MIKFRHLRGVGIGRQIARRSRALKPCGKPFVVGAADSLQKFLHRHIFRFALDGADADHAAAGRTGKGTIGAFLQPLAQAVPNGGRIFKRVERNGTDGAQIIIHRFAKRLLLIAEGGIEAGRRNTDGSREIVDLGAFIAFCPENLHHRFQRGISVETARASAWNHFLPFYSLSYIILLTVPGKMIINYIVCAT